MATANSTRKPISTELQLKKLKPIGKTFDVKVANTPGLMLRVSKTGTKSFRWDRGSGKKPRIITHGTYPSLSLSEARTAHEKARQQHAAGTLNMVMLQEEEESLEDPQTVGELIEIFYRDRIEPKRKAPKIAKRVLDVDIMPYIGEMPLSAVTPMIVRKVVQIVVKRGSTVHAGKVLSILKQLFRFGVSLGLMEMNPAQPLEPDMLGVESNKRNRALSSEEIRTVWDALDRDVNTTATTALRLLLLLGIRSGELRKTRWEDVDLDKGLLTIPVNNLKLTKDAAQSAHPFIVPLDDFAISLFRQIPVIHPEWAFPGRRGIPFNDCVMSRVVRRLDKGEMEQFVPHDLRRTMRTGLSKLKVKPHIAERCLNHAQGVIEETYDTYDYLDERREALERWSQHVQVILGMHENVVEMRA